MKAGRSLWKDRLPCTYSKCSDVLIRCLFKGIVWAASKPERGEARQMTRRINTIILKIINTIALLKGTWDKVNSRVGTQLKKSTPRLIFTPCACGGEQWGNLRRVNGLHKRNAHTFTEPDARIQEAWRIGLRTNDCLTLREALFRLWKKGTAGKENVTDRHRKKKKNPEEENEMQLWRQMRVTRVFDK